MRVAFIILSLLSFTLAFATEPSWKKYPYQDIASTIRFPEDEGSHKMIPNLEWWYTVIHATSEDSGERYSILVTHFNNHVRFFTVTNRDRKLHISGTALGLLNSAEGSLDLKHKTKHGTDIYRSRKDQAGKLIPFEYEIKTHHERMNLDVSLKALKKPLMVVGDGYIGIGSSGHSWYYSLTRLDVSGTIELDGRKEKIKGEAWMDHQWGPFLVSPVTFGKTFESYEWFCLQLNDGSDIMISNIFDRNFDLPKTENYGGVEIMYKDGVSKHTLNRKFTRLGYWKDPISGHYMSMGWRLEVPEWELDLTLTPSFLDQMVQIPLNGDFWEGSIEVAGTIAGKSVRGNSFGELIHRYQIPRIEITKFVKDPEKKFVEMSWTLKNPDAGNPLYYQVELVSKNGTKILAKSLNETKFRFSVSDYKKGEKLEIKVIGSSIDGTITGQTQNKVPTLF